MPESFPLADILTVTTGRLLSHDHTAGAYKILNYLTGDNLYTHQLPRAVDACRPALIEQHPHLVGVEPPKDVAVPELLAWLAEQEQRYGDSVPVTPIADWQHIDPIEEAVAMVGPERVIVVDMSGGDDA